MRYAGTRSLAALVPNLARKAVGKRGFTDAKILNDWPQIVGADLAREAHPDRLSFPRGQRDGGTLHIRAMGPVATELQHLEQVLIDRINSHFGYRAVARISLLQVPPTRIPGKTRAKPSAYSQLPPADPGRLAAQQQGLAAIEDPELRSVLQRLGESILRREASKQK